MNSARENLWRAVRGPVMLITVGVLFAVDHFGPYGIGRTWPVILIVLGLLKLAERTSASPSAPVDRPQGDPS